MPVDIRPTNGIPAVPIARTKLHDDHFVGGRAMSFPAQQFGVQSSLLPVAFA